MFLNKVKFWKNKKGYFTAIILAILILTLLGVLSQQVINHNLENKTIEQLIITKHLTEERSNFEYNTKNVILNYLDYNIKETLDIDIIKPSLNNILKQFLQENNFPNNINSELLIEMGDCDINLCANYKYTILNQLKKTITYENKSIEIKIPDKYTVANTVVVG